MNKTLKAKASNAEDALFQVEQYLQGFDFEKYTQVCIKAEPVEPTLSYKAVFWIWMRALAAAFTERGQDAYTDAQMHDLMCHKFLGYTTQRTIGKTVIEPALRTITYPEDLLPGEFYHFLQEIEIWASDCGVVLPEKPSQYTEDKQRQAA